MKSKYKRLTRNNHFTHMDNIHECTHSIHRKLSELAEDVLRMAIGKKISLIGKIEKFLSFAENFSRIINLQVTERVVSTCFTSLCIHIRITKVWYYWSGQAVETTPCSLACKHSFYLTNWVCPLFKSLLYYTSGE